ncbi:MAG: NfeD family protein [Clostridia bacterium]|nr:NfeD family protein [Clostridia bacterium]
MSVYIWTALFIVLIIIEAMTAQLTTIWFAVGALASAIAAFFNGPVWLQWTLFLVVSVVLILSTRKLARGLLKAKPKATNADRAIGQNGIVTEEIDNLNAKGAVNLNGMFWTARSEDNTVIPVGETVTAVRIDGVKLIVTRQETKED